MIYIHPISLMTPARQHQPIYKKKRKGNTVSDKRDRAALANKIALAQLLKLASPTPLMNTGSAR